MSKKNRKNNSEPDIVDSEPIEESIGQPVEEPVNANQATQHTMNLNQFFVTQGNIKPISQAGFKAYCLRVKKMSPNAGLTQAAWEQLFLKYKSAKVQ